MYVNGAKTWRFFYSNSANLGGGDENRAEAFGQRWNRARASLHPGALQPGPLRACLGTPRQQEKRFELAWPHLSREEPWRTGCARDIPPLTGDEVRVRTGRRMFGGKGVVQAAGEPVIGQHSCCVKRIESQQLEPVFLFTELSINYRCYLCFLMHLFIRSGPFLASYNTLRCNILELPDL